LVGLSSSYDTYTDDEGNVWIVSDCPNTDQALSGNPDGLPFKGETTDREKIETWLGDGGTVVPRNGDVWERTSDGSIVVTRVKDYMIEVTVRDVSECPSMPAVNNGVPVVFRIADTAEPPSDTAKPTPTSGVELCLPNVPNPPGFVPPKGYPSEPSIEGWLWYGTEDPWTALPFGPQLSYSPRKSVFWSINFPGGGEEETPPISVTWNRLDKADTRTNGGIGTNANTADDGWFMIAGFDPDEPGCWEVTATYKGTTLRYVYENPG